jgi:signal transduction histidine kinase
MHLPVADSLAGQVVSTGKPLTASREREGKQIKVKTGYLVEALIYIPLKFGGVTFGVFAAAHRAVGKVFSDRDENLLNVIATFASVAIQNSRLYEATDRMLAERIEELATLKEVSRAISASLDQGKVHEALMQQLRKHWSVSSASLWLRDEHTDRLDNVTRAYEAANGAAGEPPGDAVREAAQTGRLIHIPDISQGVSDRIEVGTTGKMVAELAIPIKLKERVIGLLHLNSDKHSGFSHTDILTLQTIADQLAIIIENTRLYSETRAFAEEMEARVIERTMELKQANEHLQQLTHMKDEFVANISHELRTPLTSLKVYHLLLAEKPESAKTYIDALQSETERLGRLIEDILQIASLDEGRLKVAFEPLDLNELIAQYLDDRPLLAESRQLILKRDLEPDLPRVMADTQMLSQVLGILIINALNYTPGGGLITVRTARQDYEGQQWVGLSISDTGPGIPPEEQPRLFERFYRGKAANRPGAPPGSGLGLAIAKEIAEQHGGRVEVISQGIPGKGATFTLWLKAIRP